MPLYNIDTPHYLNRRRVFIDADKRETTSPSIWDGHYNLDTLYTKIQAVELINYNIPRSIMPTFVEETIDACGNGITGNNYIDIMLDEVGGAETLTFTVIFPPGKYDAIADLLVDIPTLFSAAMDAAGHAFFNTGNGVTFQAALLLPLTQSTIFQTISLLNGDDELISMKFLFGTGANAGKSAWNVFGFKPNVDNGGEQTLTNTLGLTTLTTFDPLPDSPGNVCPYTYVDITIDEIPELVPFARIFLTDDKDSDCGNHTTNRLIKNKPRILADLPIRKLDKMTIHMKFENNIVPTTEFQTCYDLMFDFLVLVPEQKTPLWAKQTLGY